MKLQALIFYLVCTTCIVQAQRYPQAQGTLRTGGGFGFFPIEKDGTPSYKVTFAPAVGYFFSDNALGGFTMNYNGTFGGGKYDATLRMSPTLKYYFILSRQKFITANFNYNFDLETTKIFAEKKIENNPSFSIGPGGSYFFTRRIGVEATLLYTVYFFPDDTHLNKFSLTAGFNVNLPQSKKGTGKFKKPKDE